MKKYTVTMYHSDPDAVLEVHPSQVESMKSKGWAEDDPATKKTKTDKPRFTSKPKTEQPA